MSFSSSAKLHGVMFGLLFSSLDSKSFHRCLKVSDRYFPYYHPSPLLYIYLPDRWNKFFTFAKLRKICDRYIFERVDLTESRVKRLGYIPDPPYASLISFEFLVFPIKLDSERDPIVHPSCTVLGNWRPVRVDI